MLEIPAHASKIVSLKPPQSARLQVSGRNNKDYSILGFVLASPLFWETTVCSKDTARTSRVPTLAILGV